LQIGTEVMVRFSDGTTAIYKKISSSATVNWVVVPGSPKNAKGQPIDIHGNVIGSVPSNLTLQNILAALPNFSSTALAPSDWLIWSPLPGGTITIGNFIQDF